MSIEGTDPPRRRYIRDARGRRVKAIDPLKLHLRGPRDVVEPEALERIVEDLEPGARKRRRLVIFIVPALLGMTLLGGLLAYRGGGGGPIWQDLRSALTNPALFGAWIAAFLVPWITVRQGVARRVPAAMLEHRCCPHCGYGLRGLPVDPADGATICPECAAAWRLDVPERVGIVTPPGERRTSIGFVILALGLALFALLGAFVLLYRNAQGF